MKYIKVILLLLFLGCDSAMPNIGADFKVEIIEVLPANAERSGTYYIAMDETLKNVETIDQVKKLLSSLQAKGVSIKAAWYKEGAPSCGTPHGVALQVVISPILIFEVEEGSDVSALNNQFQLNKLPFQLTCPYYIYKLTPK